MDKLQALEEKLEKTKQLFAKLEHLKHASSSSSSSTLAVVVADVGKRSKIDTSSRSGSHDSKQEGGGDDDSLVVATPFTPPSEEWRSLHCQLVASINPFLRSLTRMTKRCRTSRKNFDKRSNEQEEQKLAWFANLSPEERVVAIATDDTKCVNIFFWGWTSPPLLIACCFFFETSSHLRYLTFFLLSYTFLSFHIISSFCLPFFLSHVVSTTLAMHHHLSTMKEPERICWSQREYQQQQETRRKESSRKRKKSKRSSTHQKTTGAVPLLTARKQERSVQGQELWDDGLKYLISFRRICSLVRVVRSEGRRRSGRSNDDALILTFSTRFVTNVALFYHDLGVLSNLCWLSQPDWFEELFEFDYAQWLCKNVISSMDASFQKHYNDTERETHEVKTVKREKKKQPQKTVTERIVESEQNRLEHFKKNVTEVERKCMVVESVKCAWLTVNTESTRRGNRRTSRGTRRGTRGREGKRTRTRARTRTRTRARSCARPIDPWVLTNVNSSTIDDLVFQRLEHECHPHEGRESRREEKEKNKENEKNEEENVWTAFRQRMKSRLMELLDAHLDAHLMELLDAQTIFSNEEQEKGHRLDDKEEKEQEKKKTKKKKKKKKKKTRNQETAAAAAMTMSSNNNISLVEEEEVAEEKNKHTMQELVHRMIDQAVRFSIKRRHKRRKEFQRRQNQRLTIHRLEESTLRHCMYPEVWLNLGFVSGVLERRQCASTALGEKNGEERGPSLGGGGSLSGGREKNGEMRRRRKTLRCQSMDHLSSISSSSSSSGMGGREEKEREEKRNMRKKNEKNEKNEKKKSAAGEENKKQKQRAMRRTRSTGNVPNVEDHDDATERTLSPSNTTTTTTTTTISSTTITTTSSTSSSDAAPALQLPSPMSPLLMHEISNNSNNRPLNLTAWHAPNDVGSSSLLSGSLMMNNLLSFATSTTSTRGVGVLGTWDASADSAAAAPAAADTLPTPLVTNSSSMPNPEDNMGEYLPAVTMLTTSATQTEEKKKGEEEDDLAQQRMSDKAELDALRQERNEMMQVMEKKRVSFVALFFFQLFFFWVGGTSTTTDNVLPGTVLFVPPSKSITFLFYTCYSLYIVQYNSELPSSKCLAIV